MTDEPVLSNPSAGALLRAAREKQGLHIAALAASIKVAPRKLEALEADRLSELPDVTFARALALTVCRTLKIDAGPVLARLPPANSMALGANGRGLDAPFRDRPGRSEPGVDLGAVRPLAWAGAVLAIAALAVLLAPRSWWTGIPQPVDTAKFEGAASTALGVAPAVAAPPDDAASSPLPPATPVAAGIAAPVAESASVVPAAAEGATLAVAAAASAVQLRSSQASWVEARDARGQLLLSRTLLPGEAVGIDGSLPMRLTIGNAAATRLAFRGQSVDLVPNTRDNVARVELQ